MGRAGDHRRALMALKAEMAATLQSEKDRRIRRKIEEEYEKKLEALEAQFALNDTSSDSETQMSKKPQQSRQQRRALQKEKRLTEETTERLERLGKNDLSGFEEEKMKQILPPDFEVIDLPADGNCLFHAIVHQLEHEAGKRETADSLREGIANWIEAHPSDYEGYLPDVSLVEFCESVRSTRAFGGEIEIKAASDAYGVRIRVYTSNGIIDYEPASGSPESAVLHLVFYQHKYASPHYNCLQRRS